MNLATALRCAPDILAAIGTICGLLSAWLWWRASKLEIRPYIEPTGFEAEAWVDEAKSVLTQSSALNASAARWTAIAVFAGAVGQVVQHFV
jgi:hypothetical protein